MKNTAGMDQMSSVERRNVLKVLAAGATLAVPGWAFAENSLWMPEDLPLTPQQTEGPFYPEKTIEQQLFNDTDLRRKLKGHEFAKGQQCVVGGVVADRKGRPIQGAVVEVWQACSSGRYNHSRDAQNPGLLDNNFQFWGRSITDARGQYEFKTIIPGKYPGRTARHIHYRVDAEGFKRCSTQCYFADFGADNMRDGIYTGLNRKEREQVTVEFEKPTNTSGGQDSDAGASRQRSRSGSKNSEVSKQATIWQGSFDLILANS